MNAPLIGAGFAWVILLGYVSSLFAKAVTIKNGVYIMLAVVITDNSLQLLGIQGQYWFYAS